MSSEVRAERCEFKDWPHSDGTYGVNLVGAALEDERERVWFRTAEAADAFIAKHAPASLELPEGDEGKYTERGNAAYVERCLIAAETRDLGHLDDLEAANVDPQRRRLKEIIARRRDELAVLLSVGVYQTAIGSGFGLAAGYTMPEGWRTYGTADPADDGRRMLCNMLIERAPAAPEPELVPVDLALIGRTLPTGEIVTQFTARPAPELDEASAPGGIYVEVFLNDNVWANVARTPDGRVAVLPEDDRSAS